MRGFTLFTHLSHCLNRMIPCRPPHVWHALFVPVLTSPRDSSASSPLQSSVQQRFCAPERFSLGNREGPRLTSPIPPQPHVHLKQLGATSLLLARYWGPICFGSLWKAAVTKAIRDCQSLIVFQVPWHEGHPSQHVFQQHKIEGWHICT